MTLTARALAPETADRLTRLSVRDDQRDLVAPNAQTLAEAPDVFGSVVWGLWDGDAPVGLMAMVDPDGVRQGGPFLCPGAAYLWRLMIAADRQGRGYGSAALRFAIATARGWGAGHLVVGVNDAPHGNRGFYESFGFQSSGVVEEGDLLLILDLAPDTLPKG